MSAFRQPRPGSSHKATFDEPLEPRVADLAVSAGLDVLEIGHYIRVRNDVCDSIQDEQRAVLHDQVGVFPATVSSRF